MSTARRSEMERFNASRPCPVCGGHGGLARGQGERCHGFRSGDFLHCSREEYGQAVPYFEDSLTYAHKAKGPCPCGHEHAAADIIPRNTPKLIEGPKYVYRNADGSPAYRSKRMTNATTGGKTFIQQRWDGRTFVNKLQGTPRVLYRLPELIAADPAEIVWLCEGEKDVDRLAKFDLVATTNPEGAKNWKDQFSTYLQGRDVVILEDNDEAGRERTAKVGASVRPHARSVKVIRFIDLPEHGDVSDWLDRGHSIADLRRMAKEADAWEPETTQPHTFKISDGLPKVDTVIYTNFREEQSADNPDKTVRVALRVAELDQALGSIVGNWPKRVRDTLFWQDENDEPGYLKSSAQLFAWVDKRAQVTWTKGPKFIPQERYFEHRRMNSECYQAIETLPHWPRIDGTFYMHRPIPEPAGKLDELIGMFTPATDVDRDLILAMILTAFWGGPGGSRPAFLVTGPDVDGKMGRGVGKTTLGKIVGEELAGGISSVSPSEPIETIKTRLLSPGAATSRVALIDNLKTHRFSWGDLEGLITLSEISGKALYIGEGRRPNTLLWIITLNGASLSKDMAQRCIVIKLGRPVYKEGWETDIRKFIRKYKWEILADVGKALESDPGDFRTKTRWSQWEGAVLAKVSDPVACQTVLMDRQETIDDDNEARDIVANHFRQELRRCGHNPEGECLFIRSPIAAEWLSRATRTPFATNKASNHLAGLGIPELSKTKKDGILGWRWMGTESNPQASMERIRDPQDTAPDPNPDAPPF